MLCEWEPGGGEGGQAFGIVCKVPPASASRTLVLPCLVRSWIFNFASRVGWTGSSLLV